MYTKFITERLSWLSSLISFICIISILVINHEIASRYLEADGKTKALFGLIELSFRYKYYLLLPVIISLILAIIAFQREQLKMIPVTAIVLSFLAIMLVILRTWTLMI